MYTFLVLVHLIICFALILIVLLQAGKGANMGAAFGGSSQTVFGASGASTFLGKLTAGIAVLFMLTSLILTYTASHRSSSIVEKQAIPAAEQTVPAPAADTAPQSQPPSAPAGK
jgi:preprotein translocase subunit SecG